MEIVYQDVGTREQTIEIGPRVGSRQIDPDTTLVSIEVKKKTAFSGVWPWLSTQTMTSSVSEPFKNTS